MKKILSKKIKSEYVQENFLGLAENFSLKIRRQMFHDLMEFAKPTAKTTVLDVGVTCDQRQDSNFFEKLYPYSDKITAIGMEDCLFLEKDFPGLKYIQTDGASLPFPDKSFDLALSFATIEHMGNRQRQKEFIGELSRVGRLCCITTPNRWFPLELHSITPFIHWLPSGVFRFILRCLCQSFYAKEENLNILSQKDIMGMLPPGKEVHIKHFRLFGFVSNLMFYIKDAP